VIDVSAHEPRRIPSNPEKSHAGKKVAKFTA
jgi:hypothetical protein